MSSKLLFVQKYLFNREKKWQATQTTHFTSSDYESAMRKLSDVAMRFDPVNKASSVISSKDFSAHLTAYEVRHHRQFPLSFA